MAESQATRLNRIEEKIDKLSDAMISLARAEEKLINIEQGNVSLKIELEKMKSAFELKIDRLEEDIDNLKIKNKSNSDTILIINRIFWTFVAAVILGFTSMYFQANHSTLDNKRGTENVF